MTALLALPGLIPQGQRRYERICDLHIDHNLPFGDACVAAEVELFGTTEIRLGPRVEPRARNCTIRSRRRLATSSLTISQITATAGTPPGAMTFVPGP